MTNSTLSEHIRSLYSGWKGLRKLKLTFWHEFRFKQVDIVVNLAGKDFNGAYVKMPMCRN